MSNDLVMVSAVSSGSPTAFDRVFGPLPVAACLVDGSGRLVRANALALKPVAFADFVELMAALNRYWTLVELP